MRIRVRRTGGFAGIERSAEVDTSGRPDAGEWTALAGAVLAAGDDRDGGRGGVPDGFSYEITIDGRTVRCGDPDLTDAQRTLVSRVLKEGA
ncbi:MULTISPECIES: protealysin inhibitor emfourin [unclassified Streptomyces]|uniref:protealysin inhibitor emfourin n=1 Tax=unclassified Streptomyces TaxID=2593676 RepID=UPI0006AFA661|nr:MULTISPECIES: protealysin inhibitor emfourin [unclassified Streptomyces]KOX30864.1 metalloprotease [Streptomyces sp. NRRL F-6491]KOX39720.1 metalloprotease [Streptomyces sp. NRRL F-6492]